MIVFKNYFKIVKKFLSVIILYTVIFTFFAILSTSTDSSSVGDFSSSKPNVVIINNDEESSLSNTFVDYVKENSKIVKIDNDDEKLRDALFYREVDYILTIPSNYSELFINDNNIKIETMKVPDSYSSTYAEMLFNRFWNVASVYVKSGMTEEQISKIIINDLKEQAEVNLLESNFSELEKVNYFYNFINYTMIAICIFIVGMLINVFNNPNIKKRNIISKVSYKSINRQLFLGNACLTGLIWLLYVVISIILYRGVMFTSNGLLIIINSFVFCITTLSIGFLIGNLVKNKEAQNGIVNVLALGSSFICGAFVPQEYLGSFVLGIAKCLPSYWYIKNNNDIAILSSFDLTTLQPIMLNMLIVLLFGIAFFIINNIVTKLKLKDN